MLLPVTASSGSWRSSALDSTSGGTGGQGSLEGRSSSRVGEELGGGGDGGRGGRELRRATRCGGGRWWVGGGGGGWVPISIMVLKS